MYRWRSFTFSHSPRAPCRRTPCAVVLRGGAGEADRGIPDRSPSGDGWPSLQGTVQHSNEKSMLCLVRGSRYVGGARTGYHTRIRATPESTHTVYLYGKHPPLDTRVVESTQLVGRLVVSQAGM